MADKFHVFYYILNELRLQLGIREFAETRGCGGDEQ
jgi:hypothetical protein